MIDLTPSPSPSQGYGVHRSLKILSGSNFWTQVKIAENLSLRGGTTTQSQRIGIASLRSQ
ncbi:MAG: hypothetical protein AAGM40_24385 [Cyanobacteria bacterium J06573_2]